MTEPRRRVDQNEAFHPMDGDLVCNECGQRCGEFHKLSCPRSAYDTIAEVNGAPVLVEFKHGGYAAPHGLEGVVDYLRAPGGVHDELERLRGVERYVENRTRALQDAADLLRDDSYTHRERVNLADNIEDYLLKELTDDTRIVAPTEETLDAVG